MDEMNTFKLLNTARKLAKAALGKEENDALDAATFRIAVELVNIEADALVVKADELRRP